MRLAPILAPLGLLLVIASTAPSAAQDWTGRGRVNGVVTDDASKKPVKDATVTLRLANQPDQGPKPLTTDKKGRWGFLGLLGGDWTVKIEAKGYVPSEGSIHVNEFQPNPLLQISLRTLASVVPKQDPKLAAAQKEIDAGDALLQQHKAAEAHAQYEKALPMFEGDNKVIVLRRIATCQMIEGDDAGAVDTLKSALELKPDDEPSLKLLVDRLIVLHRDDEAQQYMAKLPEGTALDPNTLLNLGINAYNDNKLEDALAKFQQVVAAKPDWPDGYYYRGLAYIASGKTAEAKADFQKVLELDPNSHYAGDCKEFLKSL